MKTRYPVARHLQQLTNERAQSFALPLLDRTGPLSCDRLLQLTPGKRASFHGYYFNDEVVAKLYFTAKKHADRAQDEIDGLRALQNAGCATPSFIYAGLSSDHGASVVLLKWLPHARTVFGLWPELPVQDPLRAEVIHQLAAHLAQQHMAGISLSEPHLAQYMWHEHQVLCIDGGRVQQASEPLSMNKGVLALSQLFAHFAPRWDVLIRAALNTYALTRFGAAPTGEGQKLNELCKQFWPLLAQFRQQRVAHYFSAQVQYHAKHKPLPTPAPEKSDSEQEPEFDSVTLATTSGWFFQVSAATKALASSDLLKQYEFNTAPIFAKHLNGDDNTITLHLTANTAPLTPLDETRRALVLEHIRQCIANSIAPVSFTDDSIKWVVESAQIQQAFLPALRVCANPAHALKCWKRALKRALKTKTISLEWQTELPALLNAIAKLSYVPEA